jgi:competence protein ComEC
MSKSNIFILFLVFLIVLVWIRISFWQAKSEYANFFGQKVVLQGKVAADPQIKNSKSIIVLSVAGYRQKILVQFFGAPNFEYGNTLFIIGKITAAKPFDDFDYPDYLAAKNIYAQIFYPQAFVLSKSKGNVVIYYGLKIKHYLFEKIGKNLQKQQAGLLISLISGNKDFLDPADVQAFNATGIAHIIAVSGFKLTLIFISLEALVGVISRRKILVLSIFFAACYLIMTDFAPAVMRAIIMSAVFFGAKLSGRQYRTLPALLLTAVILLAANPLIIKYDIGFILSFTGILGIIFFGPLLHQALHKIPAKFGLKEIFISTLAAQIATAPIIAYFFHQFAIVGPLTNLILIPLLGPTIIAGYFCALPFFGKFLALAIKIPLAIMLLTAHLFAGFKYSSLQLNISSRLLAAAYLAEFVIYLAILLMLKKRGASVKINK